MATKDMISKLNIWMFAIGFLKLVIIIYIEFQYFSITFIDSVKNNNLCQLLTNSKEPVISQQTEKARDNINLKIKISWIKKWQVI